VAAHFGGGGHDRAAAAIIKENSLTEARDELLKILPNYVLPLMTVEQIMSHGVETLPPEATINEAYDRVVRYGYEGYPIVDEGRIVGLLTRRDIDRALQHKLGNAVVSRFMSSGEVSVRPQDSISTLQSLMMEKGWGQIPVVSSQDNNILGVVTRTDVIKLWQPRPVHSERDQVRTLLDESLPAPLLELVRRISRLAQEMGLRLYFVGGLVRDILLGIPNMDIDMVVEGDAIALARSLEINYGGRVRTHARFGTAKWLLEEGFWASFSTSPIAQVELPSTIDFVTARTEFYERPTVLPQVTQGSIKLDLHRRDFTINTLAVRLNPGRFGELLDFYGGKRDLDGKAIRVLHSLSFIDDPTRILRAVRFEQRLGFRIEARTEELMLQSLALLDRITGDRIRHELELLLREPHPERGFARLADLGILAQIHPGLTFDAWAEDCFLRLQDALKDPVWDLEVDDYLIELSHFGLLTFRMNLDGLEVLERRLRVQRTTIDHIRQLHALKAEFDRITQAQAPSEVYQILEPYSRQVLLMAFVAAGAPLIRNLIHQYVEHWAGVKTVTTGRELQARGLKPGPVFSELLNELLFARLDGRVSTDEEERQYLQSLLDN
jgi:tRNA nucleotidyltransferase (CCA-adding enzyme)